MGHGIKSLAKVEGLGWETRLVCKMKLLTRGAQMMPVNHRVEYLTRRTDTSA